MNAREGLRRLGILLGACGAMLGAVLVYSDAQRLWQMQKDHWRFGDLMSTTTLQRVAQAVRDRQSQPWVRSRLTNRLSGLVVYDAKEGVLWEADPPELLRNPNFHKRPLKQKEAILQTEMSSWDSDFNGLPPDQQLLVLAEMLAPDSDWADRLERGRDHESRRMIGENMIDEVWQNNSAKPALS